MKPSQFQKTPSRVPRPNLTVQTVFEKPRNKNFVLTENCITPNPNTPINAMQNTNKSIGFPNIERVMDTKAPIHSAITNIQNPKPKLGNYGPVNNTTKLFHAEVGANGNAVGGTVGGGGGTSVHSKSISNFNQTEY